MRLMPLAIAALACAGCVSQPPRSYEALVTAMEAGEAVDVGALREAFRASPHFAERTQGLAPLERQAMRFIDEEPLRAGPVGSAILDQHRASIVGHYALAKFYDYVEREDAAQMHREWVARLRQALEEGRDGSDAAPYPVLSASEALAYLRASGRQPVGSIYRTPDVGSSRWSSPRRRRKARCAPFISTCSRPTTPPFGRRGVKICRLVP